MELKDKIRLKRKSAGYSQDEFSEIIGVSSKTLQRWEAGERSPRMEEIKSIAEKLDTPIEEFISDEKPKGFSIKNILEENDKKNQKINSDNISTQGLTASLSLGGDKNVTVPANAEGYAFLKELFLASLNAPTTAGAMA